MERHIIIFFIKNAKHDSRGFYLMNYVIRCQKDLQNINSINSKYLISCFNTWDNTFTWYMQKFPAPFLHNIRKFFKLEFALHLLLCTIGKWPYIIYKPKGKLLKVIKQVPQEFKESQNQSILENLSSLMWGIPSLDEIITGNENWI